MVTFSTAYLTCMLESVNGVPMVWNGMPMVWNGMPMGWGRGAGGGIEEAEEAEEAEEDEEDEEDEVPLRAFERRAAVLGRLTV